MKGSKYGPVASGMPEPCCCPTHEIPPNIAGSRLVARNQSPRAQKKSAPGKPPPRFDYAGRWCNCWMVQPGLVPNVIRFPSGCPNCGAVKAMPFRAGTLAEGRTQVHLTCDECRHQWSIEMTPPVLIVKPERETDGTEASSSEVDQANDRRHAYKRHRRRMRAGLCGLLKSPGSAHTVAVLYSLTADRTAGRLRLLDPDHRFPAWVTGDSRLKLSGYDGVPLRICITMVKLPRDGWKDDDHFAEFVVRPIAH